MYNHNPGSLRHRIQIKQNVKVSGDLGDHFEWQPLKKVWAQIVPQTGKLQDQQADTILTDVTHKIIVRYSGAKEVTKDMLIKFKGRDFDIKYVLNPYERNETLEIFCSEKVE